VDLRNWLSQTYDDQFVIVATEKLLTYALGRGVEYRDMPLVRQVARDTVKNNGRFSSIVLGVVKSRPFQMNTKVVPTGATTSTASARPTADSKGAN